jgi:hypothetical protein
MHLELYRIVLNISVDSLLGIILLSGPSCLNGSLKLTMIKGSKLLKSKNVITERFHYIVLLKEINVKINERCVNYNTDTKAKWTACLILPQ